MGRAPKAAECAEGGFEECAAYVEAKLVPLHRVEGRAACCVELVGQKGDGAVEDCADFKVDMEALERLMEPEEVVAAIFSSTSIEKRKKTISWQAENDGWRVRERR